MSRVFESILTDHDLRLVLLAAVICAFGSVATMSVSSRAMGTRRAALWLVLLSICAGATVWATHFIAMLAYLRDVTTTYHPGLTALSFAAGVAIIGLGFRLAIRSLDTQWARVLGGGVVGFGVVVLHYVGMSALRMPGGWDYAPHLVVTSVVFSMGFGAAALGIAFGSSSHRARLAGAALMFVMVVTLHFTAMGAVQVHPGMAAGAAAGGVTRSVLATAVAIASLSVLVIGLAGALIDQKVSLRLAAEADRFRTLADGAFEGLVVHRDGRIVDANRAARRMLGLDMVAPGSATTGWFDMVIDPGDPYPAPAGGPDAVEVLLERRDGSRFPAELCRRSIALPDGGEGELCAIRDLTARKESEARITHLALHDPLTDLPNRRFFMEFAHKTISQARRSDDSFALLAIDLDDFKHVNDAHGHAGGDALIEATARRIEASLRDADVAARFGGDEFAILMSHASGPQGPRVLAERLLEALERPVTLEYGEVAVTASIGMALYPDDGETVEELLRNADTAMYRAKSDGKAMCRFFEPHMDAALVARRRLERGLRHAISEDGLTVAYQPIVDSQSRSPLGFEALVRWADDELGVVSPSEFIPVAEETGLILPIGESVLRQACMEAVEWPGDLQVAVNLSVVQFRRSGLVETVRRALADSGLPGNRLELEVTETLLMDNRDDALRILKELKALGVRISMDDFGTGYSALSYMQCFPFDKIKIDRVFVTDLGNNEQNASIVRAVAAMGRSLKMRVVAEGVETDFDAEMLMDFECDEIQGFLIARPMPPADVRAFLNGYTGAMRQRRVQSRSLA